MSNLTSYTAYVDETGTHALDTSVSGESNLFISTAVLVKTFDVFHNSNVLSDVSKKFCGGAEIKSSKIGKDHARRLQLLREVESLDFRYCALIINKDRIKSDAGLKYKRSFYKYINSLMYERIAKEFGSVHVIADTIGGQEFMASFDNYLKGKQFNLFTRFTHEFSDSKTTPLLQLADLVTGTLGFCFVDTKKGEHSKQFRSILRPKELYIQAWPLLHLYRDSIHLTLPPLAGC